MYKIWTLLSCMFFAVLAANKMYDLGITLMIVFALLRFTTLVIEYNQCSISFKKIKYYSRGINLDLYSTDIGCSSLLHFMVLYMMYDVNTYIMFSYAGILLYNTIKASKFKTLFITLKEQEDDKN